MKKLLGVVALMLATAGVAAAGDDKDKPNLVPVVRTMEPATAKPGDVVTATGEALDAARVSAVFLTDGKNDAQVEVVQQTPVMLRFRVPAKMAPGRYFVMVLAKLEIPTLLEQPVALKVVATN